jgi:hypothetical protein
MTVVSTRVLKASPIACENSQNCWSGLLREGLKHQYFFCALTLLVSLTSWGYRWFHRKLHASSNWKSPTFLLSRQTDPWRASSLMAAPSRTKKKKTHYSLWLQCLTTCSPSYVASQDTLQVHLGLVLDKGSMRQVSLRVSPVNFSCPDGQYTYSCYHWQYSLDNYAIAQ